MSELRPAIRTLKKMKSGTMSEVIAAIVVALEAIDERIIAAEQRLPKPTKMKVESTRAARTSFSISKKK